MSIPASEQQQVDAELIDRRLSDPTRLDAVALSGLLDSPVEESFDALTRLAARLLKVPASFVSILDSRRDFYKSQKGFGSPLAENRQLEGRTFCHYTLVSDAPLVIEDTHSDALWMSVPTVKTLGVRAYVGVPIKLGDQAIGSFCVIDVQPRVWLPEELETLSELALSVAREINLRAALATARADSEFSRALIRSREEVAALVAHDLCTPLQVLQLGVALLSTQPSAAKMTVTRMASAVAAMRTMVNGLVSSSALLAPLPPKKERLSVAIVLRDAVDMMIPIAERSRIHLTLSAVAPATISGDYALMLRILGNLIGNAIKYSSPDSTVVVGSSRSEQEVRLTVADTGRGMTPDEQEHAFRSGWQGPDGMVRGDGAGLGLAIVEKLVHQHGGHVTIDSSPGRGTTMTVALPCE